MAFNLSELQQKQDQLIYTVDEIIEMLRKLPSSGYQQVQYYDRNGNLVTKNIPNIGELMNQFQQGVNAQMSKTVYVDQVNGSDTSGDGSQSAPFRTLQKAIDSVPVGGRVTIYLLSDYSLGETEEINIVDKICELNLNNHRLIRERFASNLDYAWAGRFVVNHANLLIKVGDGQIIMSPNTTGKPLNYPFYGLFNFDDSTANAGIHIHIGSSIGGNWCEVNDGQALISIHHWSSLRPAGVFVSLYPHYNRTLQLYGANAWFVDLQGAVAGIYAEIGNNDSTGYIKRDANLISVKDAIAGIVRDTNGVPRNVISNFIL